MRVFVAIALVALAGCGEDRGAAQQQDGRLVIRESRPALPRYIEGSVSFLRVERADGSEVVIDGPVTDGVQVRVAPGLYRVVSYQRPCDGNCQQLDPPVDRCEATIRVHEAHVLSATVVLRQNGGCRVREQSSRQNRRWARSHLPGLSEERARAAANARGLEMRVVRRDGRRLPLTADLVPTRANVELRSGTVTHVVGLF